MKYVPILITLLILSFTGIATEAANQKTIIGKTAWIAVGNVSFPYLARTDTGAKTTSIDAIDITITDGAGNPRHNIGRTVTFQSRNRHGQAQQIQSIIKGVSTVKNSLGTEQRYVIELLLSWKGISKRVDVNLKDRSQMTYKLLVGRNWLQKDFLVDVDRKAPAAAQWLPQTKNQP